MSSAGSVLPIVLTVVGCVLLSVVITGFGVRQILRKGAREAEQRLMAKLGQPSVLLRDESANCFGLTSLGVTQLRGNGVLVLTHEYLAFQPWFRGQAMVIPRATITAATTTRAHLGKTIGRELLLVEFSEGQGDSVAWYVRSLQPWLAALRSA
jgi:hypothetical protein